MIFAFLICCIPTVVHVLNDAHGDTKKGNDILVLTAISIVLSTVIHFTFHIALWKSLLMIFAIHTLVFDYAIVYFLRKNDVISPTAKVWSYTGKSTRWWDQLVAKVHPVLRFFIRVAVFSLAVWYWVK